MTSVSSVEYHLLGPLAALRSGAPIELGPPKQRAVLALLLLHHGRVVSTDRLVDAVWPIDAPPSATASLQAYISNLRRALRDDHGGTSPIAWRSSGYVFDVAPEQLDVTAFTAAVRSARSAADAGAWDDALSHADAALGWWRGPLLQDLADEPWVRLEATGLEEILADARETRTTALLAQGRIADAIVQAQQLVSENPSRDRGCWLLMIALYRAGRAPEALDRFRDHARRLDGELGLEPGPELSALQVSILRQEPALAAWPRRPGWNDAADVAEPAAAAPPAAAPQVVAEHVDEALVGRERETEVLGRVLTEAAMGATRWLLMTGPAGIGKTRLAQALGTRATATGGREVWAHCPEDEGSPAWWPVRQIVRALGADADAVLVPPPDVEADEARFAVYERVAGVLEEAAASAQPLVVVVDDLQWADASSARCLAYLAGAVRSAPITFALTLRESEDTARVRHLLTALARVDGHRQLVVDPLGEAAVRELADRVSNEPLSAAEAQALARRTAGNPLFVREYARLAPGDRESMPLAVRSVLGRRLDELDAGVLHVLRAAAVVGDHVDLELVSALTRIPEDEVADLLDEAADAHIVVPAAGIGGYAFGHGLLREEVLTRMPTLRRQRLHARLASLLDERQADPSLRAGHLMQALPTVDPAEALAACRAAAAADLERWSFETAADRLADALRAHEHLAAGDGGEDERDDLIVGRVDALAMAGRRLAVLDMIGTGMLDAVRERRTSTVGRLAASLLRATGSWPWVSSSDDPGLMQARLSDVEPFVREDPVAHARLLASMAAGSIYDLDRTIPERQSLRAIELAERLDDPAVLGDALLGRALAFSGLATHARESLELIDRLGGLEHEHRAVDETVGHAIALMACLNLGDVQRAEEHLRLGIVGADLQRLPAVRVQLRWAQGLLAQWHGDLTAADGHHALAAEVHRQTELHSEAASDVPSHVVELERGRLAGLSDPGLVETDAWTAAIAAAKGDRDAALAAVEVWLRTPRQMVWTTLGHATLLANVVVDLGAEAPARELAAYLAPFEDAVAIVGHVGQLGLVSYALARLRHLLGDDAGARTMLAKATEIATRGEGRPALLRCRLLAVQLGVFPGDAAAELAAVAEAAGDLELWGVAAEARTLIAA